jgi:ferredoxin
MQCNNCGECVGVCYFKARRMAADQLAVDTSNCYGCGLCIEVCPEECIQLIDRK